MPLKSVSLKIVLGMSIALVAITTGLIGFLPTYFEGVSTATDAISLVRVMAVNLIKARANAFFASSMNILNALEASANNSQFSLLSHAENASVLHSEYNQFMVDIVAQDTFKSIRTFGIYIPSLEYFGYADLEGINAFGINGVYAVHYLNGLFTIYQTDASGKKVMSTGWELTTLPTPYADLVAYDGYQTVSKFNGSRRWSTGLVTGLTSINMVSGFHLREKRLVGASQSCRQSTPAAGSGALPQYTCGTVLDAVVQFDISTKSIQQFLEGMSLGDGYRALIIHRPTRFVLGNSWGDTEPSVYAVNVTNALTGVVESVLTKTTLSSFRDPKFLRFMDYFGGSEEQFYAQAVPFSATTGSKDDTMYIEVSPITDDYGLDLLLVLILSERDFLEDFFRSRGIVIGSVIAAVACMAVLGIIFAFILVLPIERVARRMELTAQLQDDGEEEVVSRLTEVRVMQQSYSRMRAQLTVMKRFLPPSVLADIVMGLNTDSDENKGGGRGGGGGGGGVGGIMGHNVDDDEYEEGMVYDITDMVSGRSSSEMDEVRAADAFSPPRDHHHVSGKPGTVHRVASSPTGGGGGGRKAHGMSRAHQSSSTVDSPLGAEDDRSASQSFSVDRENLTHSMTYDRSTAVSGTTAAMGRYYRGGGGGGAGPRMRVLNMAASLTSKRIAVACFNVSGWHDFVRRTSGSGSSAVNYSNMLNRYIDGVNRRVAENRGVIDTFQGDHIIATFNAVSTLNTYARRSVLCAIDVHRDFACGRGMSTNQELAQGGGGGGGGGNVTATNSRRRSGVAAGGSGGGSGAAAEVASVAPSISSANLPCLQVTAGVSIGTAIVGNAGTNQMMRFTITGQCYSEASALERFARTFRHNCPRPPPGRSEFSPTPDAAIVYTTPFTLTPVLVSGNIIQETEHDFVYQYLDVVEVGRMSDARRRRGIIGSAERYVKASAAAAAAAVGGGAAAAALAGGVGGNADEWMYAMQSMAVTNPFAPVNNAFKALLRGNTLPADILRQMERELAARGTVDPAMLQPHSQDHSPARPHVPPREGADELVMLAAAANNNSNMTMPAATLMGHHNYVGGSTSYAGPPTIPAGSINFMSGTTPFIIGGGGGGAAASYSAAGGSGAPHRFGLLPAATTPPVSGGGISGGAASGSGAVLPPFHYTMSNNNSGNANTNTNHTGGGGGGTAPVSSSNETDSVVRQLSMNGVVQQHHNHHTTGGGSTAAGNEGHVLLMNHHTADPVTVIPTGGGGGGAEEASTSRHSGGVLTYGQNSATHHSQHTTVNTNTNNSNSNANPHASAVAINAIYGGSSNSTPNLVFRSQMVPVLHSNNNNNHSFNAPNPPNNAFGATMNPSLQGGSGGGALFAGGNASYYGGGGAGSGVNYPSATTATIIASGASGFGNPSTRSGTDPSAAVIVNGSPIAAHLIAGAYPPSMPPGAILMLGGHHQNGGGGMGFASPAPLAGLPTGTPSVAGGFAVGGGVGTGGGGLIPSTPTAFGHQLLTSPQPFAAGSGGASDAYTSGGGTATPQPPNTVLDNSSDEESRAVMLGGVARTASSTSAGNATHIPMAPFSLAAAGAPPAALLPFLPNPSFGPHGGMLMGGPPPPLARLPFPSSAVATPSIGPHNAGGRGAGTPVNADGGTPNAVSGLGVSAAPSSPIPFAVVASPTALAVGGGSFDMAGQSQIRTILGRMTCVEDLVLYARILK